MDREPGRELLILGLLRRSPMSAYTLDRAVRGHAPLFRAFKYGNVYHAVALLAQEGLLLQRPARSKRGPGGTKVEYRLSAAGERRFQALLEQVLCDVQAPDPDLEIAYVLLGQLPRSEASTLLDKRARQVGDQQQRLSRLFGDPSQRTGSAYLSMAHSLSRLRGEKQFLRDALALLKNPKWNPDWRSDDGAIVDPARKL